MGWFDRKTKRTYVLEEYAQRNGHTFQWKDDYGLIGYFKGFKLFKRGHSGKVRNIRKIRKDEHGEYGHFDFSYVVSTGNSHHVVRQTVYYRIHKTLMLPQFHLFPENWYHQVGKWFGMQDINFIAYPEFSKNYMIQGAQEEFIRTLFDERSLVRHFRTHKNWSIEAVGYYYIMYRSTKLQRLDDLAGFVRTGNRLFDVLSGRCQVLRSATDKFDTGADSG